MIFYLSVDNKIGFLNLADNIDTSVGVLVGVLSFLFYLCHDQKDVQPPRLA